MALAFHGVHQGRQREERGRDNNIDIRDGRDKWRKIFGIRNRLLDVLVHFPVCCDERYSHVFVLSVGWGCLRAG